MMQPITDELYFFGQAIEKFALHKAARVVGVFEARDQNGRVKKCFRLEYGDGQIAHAELSDESQGAFEFLTYLQAVQKYGEEAFQ